MNNVDLKKRKDHNKSLVQIIYLMRRFTWPTILIILGAAMIYFSLSRTRTIAPVPLSEVKGIIADHSTTADRKYRLNHYFWLKGFQCTFEIYSYDSYGFDDRVFSNSFQDERIVHVQFNEEDSSRLQTRDAIVLVKGMRTMEKVYLQPETTYSTPFRFSIFLNGLGLVMLGLVFLIIYVVQLVKNYSRRPAPSARS
jgi:hypothetical protein